MRRAFVVALVVGVTAGWVTACGTDSPGVGTDGEDAAPDGSTTPNDAGGRTDTGSDTGDDIDTDAGTDAGTDATSDGESDATSDAASDAGADADASDGSTLLDAGDAGPVTYNDFTAANWTAFDVTTVLPGFSGHWGGAFDGRYVYFVPSHNSLSWNGIVSRYDTQAAFDTAGAWASFDTQTVNANIYGYYGAVFDGRYMYFVPPASGPSGIVTRYDTQAAFGVAGSWTTFDLTTVNAGAKGFIGGTFDGRYVYFAPYYNGQYDGVVARLDTQGTFGQAASWSTFDVKTVNSAAVAFYGAVFDGRYVYFVPDTNGASGRIARYDTQATFGTAGSWSTFDIASVNATAKGFHTGAFDGRYLYLVPGDAHGTVARYDTQATFDQGASWSTFDATTLDANAKGFFGASFDGRYVTFVPHGSSIALRYDTQAAFTTAGSWGKLDLTPVGAKPAGFQGSVFDGRYLYLVPYWTGGSYSGNVFRFDAKTPPSMPNLPAFHGSFF